ncbi:hypothetical protein K435DRAFT_779200 [Dendrothele bispora CBS 962.96]|uniref:Uncharacterized protein n=1 Tax=Dendrothele bispora (strain CBS 962.96) TaxID=1314807 RepID=A0A4S8LZ49_DENBC|nr:hypothetical protein K435DRAFT_779200 [Dendrothele bispora CBS 962.96]
MFFLFPMLLVFLLPVILALVLTLIPGIVDVNPDPVPPLSVATSPMMLVHAAINSIVSGSEGLMWNEER